MDRDRPEARVSVRRASGTEGDGRRNKTSAVRLGCGNRAGRGFVFVRGRSVREGSSPRTPTPLTAYPGIQTQPSLSPDGSQVAFSWNGPNEDNFDIYVKLVGPGESVRLT